jgi:glycosyltransferase involved in cell wall biosynthesis
MTELSRTSASKLPKRTTVKISIVTLSFNQRDYLQEALESVLSQEYPDLEYIVVDPGSTDGSRELILSYGDRIAATIFEPDRGAAEGLNRGFGKATGDIYGFLNADDILFPGSLKRVAEFFRNHPDCDMVMGNGYKIDGQGRKIRHYVARDFSVRRFFYGGTQWLQQSTFFREALFKRSHGFNVANRTSWDGELFVEMAGLGANIGYLNYDLGGFRIHASSISGSGRLNEQYQQDCRRIFKQLSGREWKRSDEILSYLFRAEGILKRIRA